MSSISSAGTSSAQAAPLPAAPQRAAPQPAAPASHAAVQAASQQPAAPSSREEVQKAVKEIQRAMGTVSRDLQFAVDDDTGKTIIRVTDSQTGEVIRQIPSDELLAIAKSIEKMQGLLLRQKA